MRELTGGFSPDNGNEVAGYSGKFAGRTFGSRGAERRGTEREAGHPASRAFPRRIFPLLRLLFYAFKYQCLKRLLQSGAERRGNDALNKTGGVLSPGLS